VASTRLTALAILSARKATLTIDESGKIIRDIEEVSGKLTSVAPAATTTTAAGTTGGLGELIIAGDTSSTKLSVTQTNLAIVGGRSIKTEIINNQLIINLNNAVSFSQAVINSPSAVSPLIIRNSDNAIVFSVNPQGIPILEPKTALPGVTSGMVYISGSNVVPEGYYLGYPNPDSNIDQQANKTDITNL
jgi:hypothetical protein